MKLYTYCLRYDDGAAPNPYWGVCTLVICKPAIRRSAEPGDWVVVFGILIIGIIGWPITDHIPHALSDPGRISDRILYEIGIVFGIGLVWGLLVKRLLVKIMSVRLIVLAVTVVALMYFHFLGHFS